MYARGLSTRDIEDTLVMLTGEQVLSKSSISRVTDALWREYQAFGERDLSPLMEPLVSYRNQGLAGA